MYVPMEHNCMVDFLSKLTNIKRARHSHIVIQETLIAPNIKAHEINTLEVAHTTY